MIESEKDLGGSFDLATLFGNLLSNPETLKKAGEILKNALESKQGDTSPQNNENPINDDASIENIKDEQQDSEQSSPTFLNFDFESILTKLPEIMSKMPKENSENSLASKQQIALLSAIRPYLSEHRRELIDAFIKMNRLGAIFKNIS